MAISALLNLIGTPTTLYGAERRSRLQLSAAAAAEDRQNDPQGTLTVATPQADSPKATSTDLSTTPTDTAEISPGAQAGAESDASGGALVESFIRKRAILAYHSPRVAGQGSFDFTLDVEVAYRVIQYIPGGQVDTQG